MAATSSFGAHPRERHDLLTRLVETEDSTALLVGRVVLGLVMFPHSAQKVFGWFGGGGIQGTIGFLTKGAGLPTPIAALVIAFEFFGSIGLILGLFGRLAAVLIATVMVGAVVTVHSHVGFFMNWAGQQKGEGFEYHLLALALCAVVFIAGSGKASIDRAIYTRRH